MIARKNDLSSSTSTPVLDVHVGRLSGSSCPSKARDDHATLRVGPPPLLVTFHILLLLRGLPNLLRIKMILYKCRFTHDEMLSDAFKPVPVVDADGNVVEGLIEIESEKVNKVRAATRTTLWHCHCGQQQRRQ
jgi:Translationally controlled tumour protein